MNMLHFVTYSYFIEPFLVLAVHREAIIEPAIWQVLLMYWIRST